MSSASAHMQSGTRLKALGRLAEAAEDYRRALVLDPQCVEALNDLGNLLLGQGQAEEARRHYLRALRIRPDLAATQFNLAGACLTLGHRDEAAAAYGRAGRLEPRLTDALLRGGDLYDRLGRKAEAEELFALAVTRPPVAAETCNRLAKLRRDLGRLAEAMTAWRQSLEIEPRQVIILNALGNALLGLRRCEEALDCYRRALAIDDGLAESHYNLGGGLMALNRLEDSIAAYGRAVALRPDLAEAHNCVGNMLSRLGRLPEAVEAYRRVLALRPDHAGALAAMVHRRRILCDWPGIADEEERVRQAVRRGASGISPFTLVAQASSAEEQWRCARQWVSGVARPQPLPPRRPHGEARLRLGYLSGDFRQHAVAALTAGLFEQHDRSRFQVTAYSFGPDDGSAMRRRLLRGFDHFVDIRSLSDEAAARRIRDDGIDILVDLAGYTSEARTAVLAYRPAPVQVNYLGFPGSMGADFIDYILVDEVVAPPDQQCFYSERLVHLPDCYMVSDDQQPLPIHPPSRSEAGLPEQGLVFCSFNNSWKFSPAFFDVWMGLLRAIPGSVLWLRAANGFIEGNLRREAVVRGVDPDRLVFAPMLAKTEDHLARLRLADLFLDSLPYNAHTTANDSLWMGVPVLTLAGETFAGRVAASLLRAVRMPELITTSLADYEALALALAADPARRAALRRRLEEGRGSFPLFDTARFTRNLEAAFARMWQERGPGAPTQQGLEQ